VTLQVLGWVLLGAALLVCLGLLLGWAWTTQALQPRLRQQAEERRRLNEEWLAVRTTRRQSGTCPRCATPLSEQDWYFGPTLAEDPTDDDLHRAIPALVRGSLQKTRENQAQNQFGRPSHASQARATTA